MAWVFGVTSDLAMPDSVITPTEISSIKRMRIARSTGQSLPMMLAVSMVAAGRVLSIVAPDSAPIKRLVQEARDRGMLIDASYGRKTKAVIIMDTDHVILSAIAPETIYSRWMDKAEDRIEEEEN